MLAFTLLPLWCVNFFSQLQSMLPVAKPIFFVIGATGSGKSKVAVRFAQELQSVYGYNHVVVVNCDVYQCFDALPVCTNKPSAEEREGVSHVFLGFLASNGTLNSPLSNGCDEGSMAHDKATQALKNGDPFNVRTYEQMVTAFITDYFRQHEDAAVIVCGGTCYYVQALLFSNSLVHESESAADQMSSSDDGGDDDKLWDRLNAVDPDAASRYHPNDSRRVKRMLEIFKRTGQKPSKIFEESKPTLRFNASALFVVWTGAERPTLNLSLDRRVDGMVQRGMITEVGRFWAEYEGNPPRTSLAEAIGCKEFFPYFLKYQSTAIPDDEAEAAIEQVRSNTRRYARQQERWIKNRFLRLLRSTNPAVHWDHVAKLRTNPESLLSQDIKALLRTFLTPYASVAANNFTFPLRETAATPAPVGQETCSICGLLVYGRGQMEAHVRSKRHRGAVRRLALEKKQREVYGRELPPPKRKREL